MKLLIAAGCALALTVRFAAAGEQARAQSSNVGEAVAAGRVIYQRWCATCHGAGATGAGPASYVLQRQPPDLTVYSSASVPFPRDMIRHTLTGHIRRIHGLRTEMPIWRDGFAARVNALGITELDALLAFLESMQRKPYGRPTSPTVQDLAAAGARIFTAHCIACHGDNGRGWQGYAVGLPTDLTLIASRNAGNFELRKVFESIARCGDDWPDSDMPSWQRAFARAGWNAVVTFKQIEALATYIESIQR